MAPALIDTMGEEKALVFGCKLATQNLRVQQGSTLLVQQMSAGEFKVLIDALHYQVENHKQQGAPVDYVIPDPLLIDFLLSREEQQIFAQSNRLVARRDIDWRSLGKLPKRTRLLSVEKWAPETKNSSVNLIKSSARPKQVRR